MPPEGTMPVAQRLQNSGAPSRGLRQCFVLVVRSRREQHPKCIDAQCGTKWNIQQRDETHCEGNGPRPLFAMQQPPTREETCGGFCQQQPSDDGEQRTQPKRDFRRRTIVECVAEDDLRNDEYGYSSNRVQC